MKHFRLLFFISLSFLNYDLCHSGAHDKDKVLEDYIGNYYVKLDPVNRFVIRKEKENFILEIIGQGQTQLTKIGKDRFSINLSFLTKVHTMTLLPRDFTCV